MRTMRKNLSFEERYTSRNGKTRAFSKSANKFSKQKQLKNLPSLPRRQLDKNIKFAVFLVNIISNPVISRVSED